MIEHVWRRASLAFSSNDIYIVTGDEEISNAMEGTGAQIIPSFREHANGTSRIVEFLDKRREFDFVMILQGDEILIDPNTLIQLYAAFSNSSFEALNVVSPLSGTLNINDRNLVKCCIRDDSSISCLFRTLSNWQNFKHGLHNKMIVRGLFAASRYALEKLVLNPLKLQTIHESIEQIAFIKNQIRYGSLIENAYYPSVNTQEDLDSIYDILENNSYQRSLLNSISSQ
jgi:3-deoxy-manno-octulosonate cytidylyltransferase (CMP-KDO synthetase)